MEGGATGPPASDWAEHSTHIRHVLLYEFESGHPAAEAQRNLSQVFATEAPPEWSVRACFQRFKAGNKELEDEPRSGRPTAISFDELKEQYPYESVRYFAASLGCSLSTVSNGLQSLGIVKKLDEKWVLYVNHTQKRAWCAGDEMLDPLVKGEIHKVMLSVWWGVHGIYRFELLPDNTTVTAEVYCAQLQRLADKIRKEHPKLDNVRLLYDDARPHIAKKTSQKILELGWEVPPHPPEFYANGIRDLVRSKQYAKPKVLSDDLNSMRQQANSLRQHRRRQAESVEERSERLFENAQRQQRRKQTEGAEKRAERLSENAQHQQRRYQNEDATRRFERLILNAERQRRRRLKGNDEHRIHRLHADPEKQRRRRRAPPETIGLALRIRTAESNYLGERQQYGQVYIFDTEMAAQQRLGIIQNSSCDSELMSEWSAQNNAYARSFKMMSEGEGS
ncbi:hypothetical protein RB195_010344 [Necator americanus]|uniref:Mos1 transposase HTH domain-containing protein n=1 Tax=Necator americanus TaxID=51031 RepID=A0ABR1CYA1_NECAM